MTTDQQRLKQLLEGIRPLDQAAMERAGARWNSVAKPLHSLGKLEEHIIRIAGMNGKTGAEIDRKALIVMCADNGVVEEGVTQTGQEVTAIVAENFLTGDTSAAIMCQSAGVDLFPVDIGMAVDTKVPSYKIAYGTRNLAREPAMTYGQALQAILTGVEMVRLRKEAGYQILATGEMGIGNTTTSSAIVSVLLGCAPQEVTGRGAGLTGAGLKRKTEVIQQAIALHQPDPEDPVDVLAKVGGFDVAAMCGGFLGAAASRRPVVIDGYISAVAALCACRLCPTARDYLVPSHASFEIGYKLAMEAMKLEPMFLLGMRLGEGSGCPIAFQVLEAACAILNDMATFDQAGIDDSYLEEIRKGDKFTVEAKA